MDMQALIFQARAAYVHAYAPYSKFYVGAALLDVQGAIWPGCNIENASYGVTLCAERVALGSALACGMRNFQAIAVVNACDTPTYPCGICLQMLVELMPQGLIFVAFCNEIITHIVSDLLPKAFGDYRTSQATAIKSFQYLQ